MQTNTVNAMDLTSYQPTSLSVATVPNGVVLSFGDAVLLVKATDLSAALSAPVAQAQPVAPVAQVAQPVAQASSNAQPVKASGKASKADSGKRNAAPVNAARLVVVQQPVKAAAPVNVQQPVKVAQQPVNVVAQGTNDLGHAHLSDADLTKLLVALHAQGVTSKLGLRNACNAQGVQCSRSRAAKLLAAQGVKLGK